ncbi:SMP-30/gluconolactonase/LRE family protein, partial [bacterium]|nr:SMP-30/gluconolactonase/LRE family protein [candidate division CSSED10-310 bacterium]
MKIRYCHVAILSITAFFFMFLQSYAQNYLNEPESVVFDAARNRYLISNKGNGKIIQMKDGVQSIFNSDQASIRGLHILGETLYAACNAGVVGFNLATNTKTQTISVSGKNFLNDITSDNSAMLYVTDTGAGKIFKVNPVSGTSATFVTGLSSPNGIFYDQSNNRLLVCYFRSNSPISAVSIANGAVTQVVSTTLDDLDGIAEDGNGRIYISSWGSNAVYRYDNAFSGPPEQVSSGHSGPADIYFNKSANTLAVPNMNSNSVDFISMGTSNLLNEPASVVFDSVRNRYLVSNKKDGNIIQIADSVQSIFNSDLEVARGIHILGDRLYAACDEGVVGFNLSTGAKILTIPLPDMWLLQDITSDGVETLYISDVVEGIIYKVKISSLSVSKFVTGLNMPQGLLYDGQNHRLLVCHYVNNSPINAVGLTDSSVSLVIGTPFFNLDGLAQDSDGRVYVACRGNNNIYRYDSAFNDAPEQISNGFDGPADIFINQQDNILAVPNLNSNTVDFIEFEPLDEPPVVTENTYTVINTGNSGEGSLRQAIRDAAQGAGPDSVVFDIPKSDANYNSATGVWTITLATPLELQPDSCTIIDGTTQARNQGDTNPDGLEIELNGNNSTEYAFWGVSASNIIKGLVINRFTKSGIILISAACTGNRIELNYIGTDADGLTALPNRVGIEITSGARYNTIGGKGRRNLISGNDQWGMVLNATYVTRNEILYNFIGTDITGLNALGNGSGGITIGAGAYENIIGPDNLISGSVNVTADLIGNGILIQESHGNIVRGNNIGTGADGITV